MWRRHPEVDGWGSLFEGQRVDVGMGVIKDVK